MTSKPQFVIRHVPSGLVLKTPKSEYYRHSNYWTTELADAYLIPSERQARTTINRMRRSPYLEDLRNPERPWAARYDPQFGVDFDPEMFKIDVVVLQTTGDELPY